MPWITTFQNYLAPGWVGTLVGIVSLIAALVMYFKSRQRTGLSFAYRGERLLGATTDGLPAEITMHYRGEVIPRLTRSLLVFWNSGEKTIIDSDIVKGDPLRLAVGNDGEILSISLLRSSRDVNEISIARSADNRSEATIAFSFLDACDGAVIEVLHTSEQRAPQFLGTLRGLPQGIKNLGRITATPARKYKSKFLPPVRVLILLATIAGVIAILTSVLAPVDEIGFFRNMNSLSPSTGMLTVGVLYFLPGAFLLFISRRRYPPKLHVDDFE